jgi:hypothetical protein
MHTFFLLNIRQPFAGHCILRMTESCMHARLTRSEHWTDHLIKAK